MNIRQETSHKYRVPSYDIVSTGLTLTGMEDIHFVKGSKELPNDGHTGMKTEDLLTVCKLYLEAVNTGELVNRETSIAITKIEEALLWLTKRQEDRKERGVSQTYKP